MTQQTHQTRLRPVSKTSTTDVSDTLEPEQDTDQDKNTDDVAIEDEPCQCDELPDGIPCLPCYMDGAEFQRGDA